MKKLIASVLLSMAASTVTAATEQEYNFKIKHDDWQFTHRSRENTYHFEIGKDILGTEVVYRYADLDGTIENRIKFTTEFFAYKDLVVDGRMEFRGFDNKESHWRYRFIAEYTPHLVGPLYLYAKWQPRWSFKDAGTKFDARDQLGITYKGDGWKITPFVERTSTEGYNIKQTVSGIHWEAKI